MDRGELFRRTFPLDTQWLKLLAHSRNGWAQNAVKVGLGQLTPSFSPVPRELLLAAQVLLSALLEPLLKSLLASILAGWCLEARAGIRRGFADCKISNLCWRKIFRKPDSETQLSIHDLAIAASRCCRHRGGAKQPAGVQKLSPVLGGFLFWVACCLRFPLVG